MTFTLKPLSPLEPKKKFTEYISLGSETGYHLVKIPEDAEFVSADTTGDYLIEVRFHKKEEVNNPNYQKELEKYKKDLEKYKKDLKEWKVTKALYDRKELSKEFERKHKLYRQLKKELKL